MKYYIQEEESPYSGKYYKYICVTENHYTELCPYLNSIITCGSYSFLVERLDQNNFQPTTADVFNEQLDTFIQKITQ